MAIPFTQYLMPDGKLKPVLIDMPDEIEEIAQRFIAAGGAYEVEMLRTGDVSLTAVYTVDNERQDVEIEVVANGPPVVEAVEKIVRASVLHIGKGA